MNSRIAFYAGTFDPLTLGHCHVITEALKLFDIVYVGIGTNPAKKDSCTFSPEERVEMILNTYKGYWVRPYIFVNEYQVHVAMRLGCDNIVRGIRNAKDCEEELAIATLNKKIGRTKSEKGLCPIPSTIFIPTPPELALVSSSMVKSLIGFGDWESQILEYVPEAVYHKLLERFKK